MSTADGDSPLVVIYPSDRSSQWEASCTCERFVEQRDTYRDVHAAARRHFIEHYGPEPRGVWPGAPVAPGGVVAISPDAPERDVELVRGLWWEFMEVERGRFDDPEAWMEFLVAMRDKHGAFEEAVLAYYRAFRATSFAMRIERARHEPGWEERLYELAAKLIADDEEVWRCDLVTTGDALTLNWLLRLPTNAVVELPATLQRKLHPFDTMEHPPEEPAPPVP